MKLIQMKISIKLKIIKIIIKKLRKVKVNSFMTNNSISFIII